MCFILSFVSLKSLAPDLKIVKAKCSVAHNTQNIFLLSFVLLPFVCISHQQPSGVLQSLIKSGPKQMHKTAALPLVNRCEAATATLFCQSNKLMLSGFDCLLLIVPKLIHDRWRELIIPANKQANKVINMRYFISLASQLSVLSDVVIRELWSVMWLVHSSNCSH